MAHAKGTQTQKRVWPEKMWIDAHALFCVATQLSVCNFAPGFVKTSNSGKKTTKNKTSITKLWGSVSVLNHTKILCVSDTFIGEDKFLELAVPNLWNVTSEILATAGWSYRSIQRPEGCRDSRHGSTAGRKLWKAQPVRPQGESQYTPVNARRSTKRLTQDRKVSRSRTEWLIRRNEKIPGGLRYRERWQGR